MHDCMSQSTEDSTAGCVFWSSLLLLNPTATPLLWNLHSNIREPRLIIEYVCTEYPLCSLVSPIWFLRLLLGFPERVGQ